MDHVPITPIEHLIGLHEQIASLRHPCKVIGISMNSRHVDEATAETERQRLISELGLPVCDVYRHSAADLADATIKLKAELSE